MDTTSPRHRPSLGGSNRARVGAVGLIFAISLVLMAPPALADCSATDTTCVVTDTTETVLDTTEAVVDTTESTVEEVATVVEETAQDPEGAVGDVQATTEQAVTETIGTVEGLLETPPGPGNLGLGSGSGGTGSGVADDPTPGNGSAGGEDSTGPSGKTPRDNRVLGTAFGRGPLIDPAAGGSSLVPSDEGSRISRQPLFDRIVGAAIGVAKGLAFPLALALIVIAFVMVQNRIDRKDPKLALAPIAPDLLRFA